MKPTKLVITLPKPCSENWDEMTPVDKGRFCASCQRTVIDFTVLTDAAIINIFKAAKDDPPCGRFHYSQIGRELIEVKNASVFPVILLKRVAASLLFFQTIVTTAWAQTAKQQTALQAQNHKGNKKPAKERIIIGSVIDYATSEQLAGIIVQIKSTDIKAVTDKAGGFRLALPDSFSAAKLTIQASYSEAIGKALPGTIIGDEEISMDSIRHSHKVIMYRYPVDELNAVSMSAYKVPLLEQYDLGGPRILIKTSFEPPVARQNFWHKITSSFRKKKKPDEQ